MLNNLSVLNKVYPQSVINDTLKPEILLPVYVVKLKAPYMDTPDTFFFESLEVALDSIRDRHQAYDHLEFEVSRYNRFDFDDSISISQDIFYEF